MKTFHRGILFQVTIATEQFLKQVGHPNGREFCQGSTAAQALEEPQRGWMLSLHLVLCSSSSPRGVDGAGVARAGSAPFRSQLWLSVVHFQSRKEAASFKVTVSTTPPHHLPLQPQRPVSLCCYQPPDLHYSFASLPVIYAIQHTRAYEKTLPIPGDNVIQSEEKACCHRRFSHTSGGEEITAE